MGVKVALVGSGRMAKEHARAFADVPGTTLAGLFSRTRTVAEAFAKENGVPLVADSIAELAETTQADLVVVTVPVPAMKATAIECLRFPWTILLEKPPGIDLGEAKVIAAEAATTGRRVLVALNRRFMGSTLAAGADLETRRGPRFIHVQDQQDLATDPDPSHGPDVRKAWMFGNSIHVIDYLRAFGRGPIKRVTPIFRWNPAAPGIVVASVEFASGDRGVYEGIWNGPGPWAVTVSHPEVRWEMRPLERAFYQATGSRVLSPVGADPADSLFKPGFRRQAEAAVLAAQGESSAAVTLAESLETMDLIARIFG